MIICIDIGNTNIKYAVYDGDDLKVSFRVSTDFKRTSDEYGEQIEAIAFTGSRLEEVTIPEFGKGQQAHMLTVHLEESLLYDHVHIYLYLTDTFGLELYQTPGAVRTMLEEQTRSMPAWPEDGCYTVIDNVLVINLEEQS